MEIKNRRGKIALSIDVINSMDILHLSTLFGNFFPFQIEKDPVSLTYYGKSQHFDEIENHEIAPSYEVQMGFHEQNDLIEIKFVKIS